LRNQKADVGRRRTNVAKKNLGRREFLGGATIAGTMVAAGDLAAQSSAPQTMWDKEADVVVIGSGAVGLPAAIAAAEQGASVIVVEANRDIGGHAILSHAHIALGGGTSAQKKAGIVDSPDLVFSDLTDWSVVEPNGAADYRFNDRDIVRAFANNSAPAFEWLVAHGVRFTAQTPDTEGGLSVGNSVPREMHAAAMAWPLIETGKPVQPSLQAVTSSGVGLIRPLEAVAQKLGVQILLEHTMTSLIRENPASRRMIGITVVNKGRKLNIRAERGIIIGTGGHASNLNFRRIFDPRLTEEYCGVVGEPYSYADASGEIAAMAVGASLWGTANQTGEFGAHITKPGRVGCQYQIGWEPTSEWFPLARATGLLVADHQDVICVNQVGLRFHDETQGGFTGNQWNSIPNYIPNSYRNAANVKYSPTSYLSAAMGLNGGTGNGGGPIWAIFDADAVKREKWHPAPPDVDTEAGLFFSANTIAELADRIVNKYQRNPMPPKALLETVARYNSFVDAGKDEDFGKPTPKYRIQSAPFYAAWATPTPHDTRAGLRINARCQVQDLNGQVIPGLYCGGESAGGFSQHGLARCIVQGLISGRQAAAERV
jgi:succinate dehydrogenase/fumarate reductase flavoprotein subunit